MNAEVPASATAEPRWVKSSYSGGDGGECIEVAAVNALVHVRDSKDPQGPRLAFGHAEWTRFLRYAAES